MSDSPSYADSENRARIKESVGTLKQLYSVVIALALTEAIPSLILRTDTGVSLRYATLPWFLALICTLIPFHHGAMRHLDDAYIFSNVRYRKLTFLVDYLILFAEAGVLVWLALVLSSPQAFLTGFVLLLSIDVFWALATHFLTGRLQQVKFWLLTNVATLAVIALVHWTPVLDEIEPLYLVVVAVVRTCADYGLSWAFYFPESEERAS